jgi:O-antigen/teichoic acid export membrane protein
MSRDLRKYARQTNFRLITGFVLILFLIGDGLIYLFFGRGAAIMGLICLLAVLVPIMLILAALWIIDWIARRYNTD